MPEPVLSRPSWPMQGLWLGWMERIERRLDRPPTIFERRRIHLLLLGHAVLIGLSLPWTLHFLAGGLLLFALGNTVLILAALASLVQVARGRVRRAAIAYPLVALAGLIWMSVVIDTPTATVPRCVHLFLMPLALLSYFILQYEQARVRFGVTGLILAAFCALAAQDAGFGFPVALSGIAHQVGCWTDTTAAIVALYLALDLMHRDAQETSLLELDFAHAIASRSLEFHLQPQCGPDGRVLGAEALMRWTHPRRGVVSPAEFIPMAERSGLIAPAGDFLLEQVCALLARWRSDAVLGSIPVAVNVSAVQLRSDADVDRLIGIVQRHLPHAPRLKVELTESIFVSEFAFMQRVMQRFRNEGIAVSLDDFGTGYSSLAYLRRLPLDQIKIDQSFVRDLPGDQRACHIARTVVQLSRELGLEAIAEGVETAEQRQVLEEMGCRLFQGYLFSRPLTPASFERFARDAFVPART